MKKRHYRRRSAPPFTVKKETMYTVGAIWFWLIAGTITLAFFSDASLLTRIREELIGYVGWGMYGIPPYLVLLSLLFFRMKSPVAQPPVSLGVSLLFLSILSLTQQGVVGESLFDLVASRISAQGGVFVYITTFVIGLLLTFNSSLDKMVEFLLLVAQRIVEGFGHILFGLFAKKDRPQGVVIRQPLQRKDLDQEEQHNVSQRNEEKRKAEISPKISTAPFQQKTLVDIRDDVKISIPLANQQGSLALWQYPPISLLSDGPASKVDRGDLGKNGNIIVETLQSFGIRAQVREINAGPAVTQYALEIPLGTKVSKITSLSSDLALALAAPTGAVRIEAPIPGKSLIGIEIPNRGLEFVTLKHMLKSQVLREAKSKLTVPLGLDVSGKDVVADIAKMPHVLIAGTTGSGKSVLVNVWIASLLFRTTPAEVRIIMIDPKRVELAGYNGVPHLLTPVIVEIDKILSSLRWAVAEMENRYNKFAEVGVRNIEGFNELSGFQAMPYIVIFIDELADLMAYAPSEVEDAICRLAQKARAAGIHLVLATQRPSVDVITGLIKANIPTRIAFNVSSMVDSRVIIDTPGAEKLLGRGDMLYIPVDSSKPTRIQGVYVSEKEIAALVDFLKEKNLPVAYTEEVLNQNASVLGKKGGILGRTQRDPLFDEVARFVMQHDKASTSQLQRKFALGFNRAGKLMDQLEEAGIVGPNMGSKPRDVLIRSYEEFLATQEQSKDSQ